LEERRSWGGKRGGSIEKTMALSLRIKNKPPSPGNFAQKVWEFELSLGSQASNVDSHITRKSVVLSKTAVPQAKRKKEYPRDGAMQ